MKLTIYHTNDIHSHFDRLTQIASFLKAKRKPQDLVFDCGDLCDLRSTVIQGTQGKGAIEILKSLNYDALCIGNNEIDLEKNSLAGLSKMGLPIISCNVLDEAGKQIGHIQRSMIIERCGIRFLVIGISPYYNAKLEGNAYNQFFLMGNIQTVDPISSIQREIANHQGQYDFCILLSHSGLQIEEKILEKIKEIDLCLGGHSHSLVQKEHYSQAGGYGQYVGVVELTIDHHQITDIKMHMEENNFAVDQETCKILQKQEQKADAALAKTLYTIDEMPYDVVHESQLINFICDALYAEYPCDFAFMNAGIVSGSVSGAISKKKLLELSPSKLNPTRFPVSGKNIRKAIEQSFDKDYVMQDGRGSGFRGTVLGTLGFSANVRIHKKTMAIYINDELLVDDKIYDCVANDYLQRGSGYPSLQTEDEKAEFYYGFIRDLLERNLNREELVQKSKIHRIIE